MRLKVKTNNLKWVNDPILVLFSIHTAFHAGQKGAHKVKAMMDFIKANAQNKITVLLCEDSHMNTFALNYDSFDEAKMAMRDDAKQLAKRFEDDFAGCEVVYWQDFVSNDADYTKFKNEIMHHYQTNAEFQQLVLADAFKNFTPERAKLHPNKEEYIQKDIQDLLEQMMIMFVGSKKGYRHQLYPGKAHSSGDWIVQNCFSQERQLKHVTVWVLELND